MAFLFSIKYYLIYFFLLSIKQTKYKCIRFTILFNTIKKKKFRTHVSLVLFYYFKLKAIINN